MKRDTTFYKNLILGGEFDKYLIENPDFAEKIPDNALVVLLPQYDPELCEENLKIAKRRVEGIHPIIFIRIEKLAPPPKSRIITPQLELTRDI